jgi:hypothetical protein
MIFLLCYSLLMNLSLRVVMLRSTRQPPARYLNGIGAKRLTIDELDFSQSTHFANDDVTLTGCYASRMRSASSAISEYYFLQDNTWKLPHVVNLASLTTNEPLACQVGFPITKNRPSNPAASPNFEGSLRFHIATKL